MCVNNQGLNPAAGTWFDPRKHAFSVSGQIGKMMDSNGKLKAQLRKERATARPLPAGTKLVAKGYGADGT